MYFITSNKRPLETSDEPFEDILNRLRYQNASCSLDNVRDVFITQLSESMIEHLVFLLCEEVEGVDENTISVVTPGIKQCKFLATLGNGDSIPRCDIALLRIPLLKDEIQFKKKNAKKQLKKKIKKFKKMNGEVAQPGEFYLVNDAELEIQFPSLPYAMSPEASEFVSTTSRVQTEIRDPDPLMFALDCEMCRTTQGPELTRVTVVNYQEEVILDEFVCPLNPIIDYCTEYSGITAETLKPCRNNLKEVQAMFLALVPSEAILVGHSIENDLRALKILHRRIIDTSLLFPHPRGPPYRSALRFLAKRYLHKTIQTGSSGHCSIEDASTALQLVKLRINRGPSFPHLEQQFHHKKVCDELIGAGKSSVIIDSPQIASGFAGDSSVLLFAETNDESESQLVRQLQASCVSNFIWARMRKLTFQQVDQTLGRIAVHLPDKSVLVAVVASDTRKLRELHALRTARRDPRSSLQWGIAEQSSLDAAATKSQQGLVCVCVKK